jgi:molybdopterin/thiamine biosynthesis adenylyltransferase
MAATKLVYKKKIRAIWSEEEQMWYYCLNDVIKALTNIKEAKNYLKDIRNRDQTLNKNWKKLVTTCVMDSKGGKQPTVCSDAACLLEIIKSLSSKKAKLFRLWLNRVMNKKKI